MDSLLKKMIVLALVAVLPLAAFALVVVIRSVGEGRERALDKTVERTRLMQAQLDDHLDHLVAASRAFATDVRLASGTGNLKFTDLGDHDRFLPPTVTGVFAVRPDGQVLATHAVTRDFEVDLTYLANSVRGANTDGIRPDTFFARMPDSGVVYVLSPVTAADGAVLAYTGLSLREDKLAVHMAARFDGIRGTGPGVGVQTITFDATRAAQRPVASPPGRTRGEPTSEPIVRGDLYSGISVELPSQRHPWTLSSDVPRSGILAPALDEAVVFGILAVVACLLAANFAVRTGEGIVAPIRGLREGTRRLAAGDLDHRMIPVPGTATEFVELAGDFNAMATRIAQQRGALLAVEERWKLALDGAGHGVFDWNVETGDVYFSPRSLESLGLGPGEFGGTADDWVALVHPEDYPDAVETWKNYRNGRVANFMLRLRMRMRAGAWRWFIVRGEAPERLANGRLQRLVGTITDIDDRVSAEVAAANANRVFRAVFEECPHPMSVISLGTQKFTMINAASTEALGYTAEDVVGRSAESIALWSDTSVRARFWTEFAQKGRVVDFLAMLRSKNGAELAMLVYASRIEVAGEAMCLIQTIDVTEREKSAKALSQSRETFESLFNHSPHPLIVISATDRVVRDVNAAALDAFGYKREEVVGQATGALPLWDDPAQRQAFLGGIARGEPQSGYECRMRARDGTQRLMVLSAEFVVAGGEALILVQGVDLTAMKLLEENARIARAELARVNRDLEERVKQRTGELQTTVDELESFSYSVAHDLRAPLRSINAYLKLAAEHEAAIPQEAQQYIAKADASVSRMTVLIDDLLAFARAGRRQVEQKLVDFDHVARDIAGELQPLYLRAQITVGPLPPVTGDAFMLHQLLENLMDNALKFSAEREVPRIEVSAEESKGRFIYSVGDNGVGVDPRYAGKLFRVFERLHDPARFTGTGVGLAIAKRIVERHGGRIWHTPNPGGGSVFSFTLGGLPASPPALPRIVGISDGNIAR